MASNKEVDPNFQKENFYSLAVDSITLYAKESFSLNFIYFPFPSEHYIPSSIFSHFYIPYKDDVFDKQIADIVKEYI